MNDITASIGRKRLSFRASATSTSSTIVIPAGAQIGDLAVLIDQADTNFGPPSQVIPTDWTLIDGNFFNDVRTVSSYKFLEAGDPGATITGMNGNNSDCKVMLVFKGVHGTALTINDHAIQANNNSGISPQTINASDATERRVIVIGASGIESTFGGTEFVTESPAFDDIVDANSEQLIVGYSIYNGEADDHTIDMDNSGAGNYLESFYITIP